MRAIASGIASLGPLSIPFALHNRDESSTRAAAAPDTLEILEFVPESDVDPALIARTLYFRPKRGADRATALLAQVLRERRRLAIGKLHLGGRERLVALRPCGRALALHVLFFADDLADAEHGAASELDADELAAGLELVRLLVDGASSPAFAHDRYARATAPRRPRRR